MQLKHIKSVISKLENCTDVNYSGTKVKIVRDAELIGKGLYGYTYPDGKTVNFYPDAFLDIEKLVKTIGHENVHLMQIKMRLLHSTANNYSNLTKRHLTRKNHIGKDK